MANNRRSVCIGDTSMYTSMAHQRMLSIIKRYPDSNNKRLFNHLKGKQTLKLIKRLSKPGV